jgi:CRP/FNR family cyclic AMP-dependent transcriptional regulator
MKESQRFMVVDSNLQQAQEFLALLNSAFPDAVITHEKDARTALFKMQNVTYHLLITIAGELEKNMTGLQLVNSVLQDRAISPGIVVLTEAAVSEGYTQEVLNGRITIIASPTQPNDFTKAIGYALNFKKGPKPGSFEIHSLAAGEILFFEGDKADLAYLVKSGTLRATRSRDGVTEILGEIKAGEFVGEMAHINGDLRSASIVAVENSELIRIPHNVFESLLFTKPKWSMAMVKTLSKRLKAANGQ